VSRRTSSWVLWQTESMGLCLMGQLWMILFYFIFCLWMDGFVGVFGLIWYSGFVLSWYVAAELVAPPLPPPWPGSTPKGVAF
jgi:uncharacterized SAM-binding protein YcdF (DUF218 family)